MTEHEEFIKMVVGKTLTNLFFTKQDGPHDYMPGISPAYYFSTIMELDNEKKLNYIFFMLAFISCQTQNSIPKEVSGYLTETLDLLEENSVNKNEIDWNEFRIDIFKKAQNAKKIKDTYSAISDAVSKLNDNHSYFKPITETETNFENKPLPVLSDEITPDDIGYVRIPFCIGTENEYNVYISTIRKKIEEQSQKKLKGWIVDLRGNFGGNMWPMLLSVEPLIGNGTLGYFVVSHELSDGSIINLAESIFADRKKTKFGSKIIPDFQVEENQTLKAGIEWIYEMNKNYR